MFKKIFFAVLIVCLLLVSFVSAQMVSFSGSDDLFVPIKPGASWLGLPDVVEVPQGADYGYVVLKNVPQYCYDPSSPRKLVFLFNDDQGAYFSLDYKNDLVVSGLPSDFVGEDSVTLSCNGVKTTLKVVVSADDDFDDAIPLGAFWLDTLPTKLVIHNFVTPQTLISGVDDYCSADSPKHISVEDADDDRYNMLLALADNTINGNHDLVLNYVNEDRFDGSASFRLVCNGVESPVITVSLANRAPVFGPVIGRTEIVLGGSFSLNLSVYDPDARYGDDVAISPSRMPDGARFIRSSNTFVWTPLKPGTYEVVFVASDGEVNVFKTVNLVVKDNLAPFFDLLDSLTINGLDAVNPPVGPFKPGQEVNVSVSLSNVYDIDVVMNPLKVFLGDQEVSFDNIFLAPGESVVKKASFVVPDCNSGSSCDVKYGLVAVFSLGERSAFESGVSGLLLVNSTNDNNDNNNGDTGNNDTGNGTGNGDDSVDSMIEFGSSKFYFGDDSSKSVREGRSFTVARGEDVSIKGDVRNLFDEDSGVSLRDVRVTLTVYEIDDGDDLVVSDRVGTISDDDERSFSIEFEVPSSASSDEYDATLEVVGKRDDTGERFYDSVDFTIEVSGDSSDSSSDSSNSISVSSLSLSRDSVACSRSLSALVTIVNNGDYSESVDLSFSLGLVSLSSSTVVVDAGSTETFTIPLVIGDYIESGDYAVSVFAFDSDGNSVGSSSTVLRVDDCADSSRTSTGNSAGSGNSGDSFVTGSANSDIDSLLAQNQGSGLTAANKGKDSNAEFYSFRDSAAYDLFLALLLILLLAAVVFMAFLAFGSNKKPRRRY